MATNKLRPFANGDDANVTSWADWQSDEMASTLDHGFESGIAKSAPMNRLFSQGAAAGYSIGELVKDFAGKDADIDAEDLYPKFVEALRQVAKTSVLDVVYPVGSIYCSTKSTNPKTLFGVGTWARIGEGRCLIDAGSSTAAGSTGGSTTHTLTVNEMPAHSHSGSTASAGAHTHNRGSMEITGGFTHWDGTITPQYGAFYDDTNTSLESKNGKSGKGTHTGVVAFKASRSWTGATNSAGSHTHTVTVSNTGGGKSFSIRTPYLAVYIWKRTA